MARGERPPRRRTWSVPPSRAPDRVPAAPYRPEDDPGEPVADQPRGRAPARRGRGADSGTVLADLRGRQRLRPSLADERRDRLGQLRAPSLPARRIGTSRYAVCVVSRSTGGTRTPAPSTGPRRSSRTPATPRRRRACDGGPGRGGDRRDATFRGQSRHHHRREHGVGSRDGQDDGGRGRQCRRGRPTARTARGDGGRDRRGGGRRAGGRDRRGGRRGHGRGGDGAAGARSTS